MAKLRKLGNIWYARIRLAPASGQTERCVNLKTKERQEAVKRLAEVNVYEGIIKSGEDVSFSWMNIEGATMIADRTLRESFDNYLKIRSEDVDAPLRPSSYQIYELSFNRIVKYLAGATKLSVLKQADIEMLKTALVKAKYSRATVNITLRNMRSWYGHLKAQGQIKADLIIKQIPKKEARPIYIRNSDFEKILNVVDPYLQRVFIFYRGCGARLREPFDAELDGNFLVIPASKSKNGKERELYITEDQILTYLEMKERTHIEHSSGPPNRKTYHYRHYSKAFQQACTKIGLKGRKFHSLRHTAAVRNYLIHRDIMATARMLGHSSIVTTEIYTKFDLRRLQQDFPDIIAQDAGPDQNTVLNSSDYSNPNPNGLLQQNHGN
ncbi:MAG: site-specific integrase [Candidatus Marinimicrobia bacterium]|nr:site-specific integrase [Candidatus Neomarinimicrobiota bacterium]